MHTNVRPRYVLCRMASWQQTKRMSFYNAPPHLIQTTALVVVIAAAVVKSAPVYTTSSSMTSCALTAHNSKRRGLSGTNLPHAPVLRHTMQQIGWRCTLFKMFLLCMKICRSSCTIAKGRGIAVAVMAPEVIKASNGAGGSRTLVWAHGLGWSMVTVMLNHTRLWKQCQMLQHEEWLSCGAADF